MNILVVIPVQNCHKHLLESHMPNGKFIYKDPKTVTKDDVYNADIIIGNVNPQFIAGTKQLKWLQLNSAGTDGYCKEGILPSDAKLTNASGAYGLAISEHMIGLVLALQKKLYLYRDNQKLHLWKDEGTVTSIEGSTTLIVGMGDIGGTFAQKMKTLGSYTIGIRKNIANKPDYIDELLPLEKLDSVLSRADIVALSLPGTKETYHLFDHARISKMKKSAILINVGRGNAIDMDALNDALISDNLGGAGIDVTDPEPLPSTHPLWDAPRMIITPHISGSYHLPETFERIVRIAAKNLKLFQEGKELMNEVDFQTGYRRFKEVSK